MIKKNAVNNNKKSSYSLLKKNDKNMSTASPTKNKTINSHSKSTKEDSKSIDETQRKDKSYYTNKKINSKQFNLPINGNKNSSLNNLKENKGYLEKNSPQIIENNNLNESPNKKNIVNSTQGEEGTTLVDTRKENELKLDPLKQESFIESLGNELEKTIKTEKIIILKKYCTFREFKIKRTKEIKLPEEEIDIAFNKQKTEIKINNKFNFASSPLLNFKQQYLFSPSSEKMPEIFGCSPIKGNRDNILLKDEIDPYSENRYKFTALKQDLLNEIKKTSLISEAKPSRNLNKLGSSQNFQTTLKILSETRKTVNHPNIFEKNSSFPKQITVFKEFLSPKNSLNKIPLDMKKTLEKFYEKNQNLIPIPDVPVKASTKFELYNLKKTSENIKKTMLNDIKNNITSLKNRNKSNVFKNRNKSMI